MALAWVSNEGAVTKQWSKYYGKVTPTSPLVYVYENFAPCFESKADDGILLAPGVEDGHWQGTEEFDVSEESIPKAEKKRSTRTTLTLKLNVRSCLTTS